jgi:hypothetical protein
MGANPGKSVKTILAARPTGHRPTPDGLRRYDANRDEQNLAPWRWGPDRPYDVMVYDPTKWGQGTSFLETGLR